MASKSGRPKAPAWTLAALMNSFVATATAGIPRFSNLTVSCKLHVVQDPQSARPSTTASAWRSCLITGSGAFLV